MRKKYNLFIITLFSVLIFMPIKGNATEKSCYEKQYDCQHQQGAGGKCKGAFDSDSAKKQCGKGELDKWGEPRYLQTACINACKLEQKANACKYKKLKRDKNGRVEKDTEGHEIELNEPDPKKVCSQR